MKMTLRLLLGKHLVHSAKTKGLACDGVGDLFVLGYHHIVIDFVADIIAYDAVIVVLKAIGIGVGAVAIGLVFSEKGGVEVVRAFGH